MSTLKFNGNASSAAQVTAWLFGGTWESNDIVNVTINGKTVSTVTGSATITTIIDTVVTALNASTITEFAEITWSRSSNSLVGTADTAGLPFTATVSTTETGGGAADSQTIDGTTSSTGTNSTANGSANDISITTSWSTAALPVNSDTLVFEGISTDALYGLNQSSVTGVTVKVDASYSGKIGLPYRNANGYAEYRTAYLRYGISTLIYAGTGGRAKFDCGSTSATITINNSGASAETGLETVLLKGSSIATLNVNKGSVAVAPFADETSAVTTANIAYVTNPSSDAKVRFGSGCTLTTLNMLGGQVQTNQAITTVVASAGTHIHKTGNITTYKNEGATLVDNAAHTITTYIGTDGSVLDASQATGAITITNCTLYKGAKIIDPFRRITFTNAIVLQYCGLKDVDLDFGEYISLAVTAL